jgi:HSP20 family molecular chaperone IbpA
MGIKKGFWNIEEGDEDLVWLNISFKCSFLFETLNDTLFGELDNFEPEAEGRIFDQQIQDIIYLSKPNKLVGKYKKAKRSKSKKVCCNNLTNISETDEKLKMKQHGYNIIDYPRNISRKDDPLVDIIKSENQVKIVIEMPLVNKKDIHIDAYDDHVEVYSSTVQESNKYHHVIKIPSDLDINSGKSTYRNGILEIVFCKRTSFKIKVK